MSGSSTIPGPSANSSPANSNNFLKNIFPQVKNFARYVFQYPKVVNLVPDFFITVYKLEFDYSLIVNTIKKGGDPDSETLKNMVKVSSFQLNDVRDVRTTMAAGKQLGNVSFTLNDPLINVLNITQEQLQDPDLFNNRELSIDKMDIIKVFKRNRFDDNYSTTFTGYVTSVQHRDVPKSDFAFVYTGSDITTALRLSQTVTQASMTYLLRNAKPNDPLVSNIYWENSRLLGTNVEEIIQGIIANSSYIYPALNQIRSVGQMPTNDILTRVQVQNPQALGLASLVTFPSNFPSIQAYGNVFKNFNSINFYQSKSKTPFDVIKDMADVIGFEFYALPDGSIYFGIPKYDMDVDGSYYNVDFDGSFVRKGRYELDGTLHPENDPTGFQETYFSNDEINKYIVLPEDFLSWDEVSPIDNVFTRVDVSPTSFGENITKSKAFLKEIFGEAFIFCYPDFKFDEMTAGNFNGLTSSDEKFRDLIRYGLRIFPVEGKAFLYEDQAIRAYAQFVYDRLKGMRRTGTLSILSRPEIVQGRTIRIPHKNIIGYISSIAHDTKAKKSDQTTCNLTFVRSADIKDEGQDTRFFHDYNYSKIESSLGGFVPAGTFDFTQV